MAEYNRVQAKNKDLFDDLAAGEEGLDYIRSAASKDRGPADPRMPNVKVFERELKAQINLLKLQEPEKAKEFENYYFKRNDIDEIMNTKYDMSEVKIYPGSDKGPNPEDDPENYSRWFIENQPKQIYPDGYTNDYRDIGAKRKYVEVLRDLTENIEHKSFVHYFQKEDEIYPLSNYKGIPEQVFFDREEYNVENDDELPAVNVTSSMNPDELAPLPSDHTYDYQQVHWELERWSIFRGLPMMMQYD